MLSKELKRKITLPITLSHADWWKLGAMTVAFAGSDRVDRLLATMNSHESSRVFRGLQQQISDQWDLQMEEEEDDKG